MEASVGMIPMVKSWICNTATMEGVHKNTLLILDEPGKELLDAFDPAKGMHVVQDSIPKYLQGSWNYGILGYWRMMQSRFRTILDIIELGNVPVMVIEPDAVWLGSPLDDPEITDNDAHVMGFIDGGKDIMGFGFLRLNPTDTVINLLNIAGKSVDEALAAVSKGNGGGDEDGEEDPRMSVDIMGEQIFFSRLVASFHKEHPDRNFVHVLPRCRYPAGSWFFEPQAYNDKCKRDEQDSIVVLQNNWIIGNEAKMNRAKEWGQWFVTEDGDRCIQNDLTIARQSVNAGVKPKDLKIATQSIKAGVEPKPEELVEDAKVPDLSKGKVIKSLEVINRSEVKAVIS